MLLCQTANYSNYYSNAACAQLSAAIAIYLEPTVDAASRRFAASVSSSGSASVYTSSVVPICAWPNRV